MSHSESRKRRLDAARGTGQAAPHLRQPCFVSKPSGCAVPSQSPSPGHTLRRAAGNRGGLGGVHEKLAEERCIAVNVGGAPQRQGLKSPGAGSAGPTGQPTHNSTPRRDQRRGAWGMLRWGKSINWMPTSPLTAATRGQKTAQMCQVAATHVRLQNVIVDVAHTV